MCRERGQDGWRYIREGSESLAVASNYLLVADSVPPFCVLFMQLFSDLLIAILKIAQVIEPQDQGILTLT
jgi:hypothetical protein